MSKAVMLSDDAISAILATASDKNLMMSLANHLDKENRDRTTTFVLTMTSIMGIFMKETLENIKSDTTAFDVPIKRVFSTQTETEKQDLLETLEDLWTQFGTTSTIMIMAKELDPD
jgi:hypothetical protein